MGELDVVGDVGRLAGLLARLDDEALVGGREEDADDDRGDRPGHDGGDERAGAAREGVPGEQERGEEREAEQQVVGRALRGQVGGARAEDDAARGEEQVEVGQPVAEGEERQGEGAEEREVAAQRPVRALLQ